MEFEWDLKKEEANIIKHGCSFDEAIETFKDPSGIPFLDSLSIQELKVDIIG